jgi:hypothetical protein
MVIWYISPVLECGNKKNLATLIVARFLFIKRSFCRDFKSSRSFSSEPLIEKNLAAAAACAGLGSEEEKSGNKQTKKLPL